MPSKVESYYKHSEKPKTDLVFPGGMSFVINQGHKSVIVRCDASDRHTDIFVFEAPEDFTSIDADSDEELLIEQCTPDNHAHRLLHGGKREVYLPGLASQAMPTQMVMSHSVVMANN